MLELLSSGELPPRYMAKERAVQGLEIEYKDTKGCKRIDRAEAAAVAMRKLPLGVPAPLYRQTT